MQSPELPTLEALALGNVLGSFNVTDLKHLQCALNREFLKRTLARQLPRWMALPSFRLAYYRPNKITFEYRHGEFRISNDTCTYDGSPIMCVEKCVGGFYERVEPIVLLAYQEVTHAMLEELHCYFIFSKFL